MLESESNAGRNVNPGGWPTDAIARSLAQSAASSDRAVIVGNRAGVVGWANPAWTRITGFPLSETIAKPITHFLDVASIEIDLVDFVSQHFVEGRCCTIEFPFETFDERSIWVHLEVQPIRNEQGEISDFVAIASDASERRQDDLDRQRNRQPNRRRIQQRGDAERERAKGRVSDAPERILVKAGGADTVAVSLSQLTAVACTRFAANAGLQENFDICLDPDLARIPSDPCLLDDVTNLLLAAASFELAKSRDFVTVLTGRAASGRRFLSAAHPIPVWPAELAKGACLYLEIHDTTPTLRPEVLEAVRNGSKPGDPRGRLLAKARETAQRLGAGLHIDSTPGCGTQALLLLPIH